MARSPLLTGVLWLLALWCGACSSAPTPAPALAPTPAPAPAPAPAAAAAAAATATETPAARTEVLVLGMIHSRHRTSAAWGLDQVRATIVAFRPDVVCCELPPDRWERIDRDWRERHVVEDDRARVFPEYTDVLLPLRDELPFVIEPCAAWTRPMSDLRNARLAALDTDPALADLAAEHARRNAEIAARHDGAVDDIDDPRVIHSEDYDRLTAEELAPYDELLNDYLGPGGWTNINRAHLALIDAALDRHRGERVLITFGAGHKHRILEHLRARSDVQLLDATPFLPEANPAGAGR